MLTLIMIGFSGVAQDDYENVTVGNSTTASYYAGFAGWYGYTWSVQTYLASELNLGQGSTIAGLAWNFGSVSTGSAGNTLTLYIKEISEDGVAGTTNYAEFKTDAQVCYSGSMNFIQSGWSYLELDEPYEYNGGNLVVIAESQGCTTSGGCIKNIYYTAQENTDLAWTFFKDSSPMSADQTFSQLSTLYNSSYHYRPDIKVYYIEGYIECHAVSSLAVSNIESTSATVTWAAPEDGGNYILQYKTSIQSWEDDEVVTENLTDTQYDLSGLSPVTTYNVRVINDCGSSQSSVRSTTFTTACGAISALPYSIDFESVSSYAPDCWDTLAPYSGYPRVTTSNPYGGSGRALEFHSNTNGSYAVLPVMEEDLSNLQIKFYTRREGSSSGTIHMGLLNDITDLSTFTEVFAISSAEIGDNDYHKYIVSFADAEYEEGARIAFKYTTSSSAWYWFVDNIEVDYIDPCPEPMMLKTVDFGVDYVALSWQAGDVTDFSLFYKSSTDEEYTEISGVSLNENGVYELYGLEDNTQYTWYVVAHCDEDVQSDSATFKTPCAGLTEIPVTWNFDEGMTGSNPLPECWTRGIGSSTSPYCYNSSTYAHSGSYSMYFFSNQSTVSITPVDPDALSITDMQLKFYARTSSSTSVPFAVGVMSSPSNPSSFDTIAVINVSNTHQLFDIPLDSYEGSGRFITFKALSSSSVYVDDVVLEELPSCPRPLNLVSELLSPNEVQLTWSSNGSEFNLYFKTSDAAEWDLIEGISEPTYTLEGLSSATIYQWYVELVCSDTIMPSQTATFTTPCGLLSLPYIQNFEDYASDATPLCWSKINPYNGFPKVNTSYPHESAKCLKFQCSSSNNPIFAVMPTTEEPINNVQLSFWTRREGSSSGTLSVGYVTNASDSSTFVPLWSMSSSEIGDDNYHFYKVNFSGVDVVEDNYNIAFKYITNSSAWYWFVDDVTLDYAPACAAPVALTSSNITPTSADLSWTSDADNVNLYYKTVSAANYEMIENVSLEDGVYTLSDLNPATVYNWYLSVICDDGTEEVSLEATFVTGCDAIASLPIVWNFENGNIAGTSSYPLPACWARGTSSTTYPYVYSSYAHSGSKDLYFGSMGSTGILPEISTDDLNVNELQITFYARTYSTSNTPLLVGVMTDPLDNNSFNTIATVMVNSTHEYFTVPFGDYEGEGSFIALRANSSTGIYVDDVTLEPIPACSKPTDLAFENATTSSVDLSWTSTGEVFDLYYKALGTSEYESVAGVSLTDGVYTLAGLETSTTYEWYVQTACGTDFEPVSEHAFFATAMLPAELPYFTDFEEGSDLQWMMVSNGATNKWQIGNHGTSNNDLFLSSNSTSVTYVHTPSCGYAQKLFTMPLSDSLLIKFNVTCGGESTWDHIKVLMIPTNVELTAGSVHTHATSTDIGCYSSSQYAFNFTPYKTQSTGSVSTYPYMYNLTNGVVSVDGKIANPAPGGEAYLVFYWSNDGGGGDGIGATIDSIELDVDESSLVSCPKPIQVTASNVAATTANISWFSVNEEHNLYYRAQGETEYTQEANVSLSDGYYTLENLNPSTTYQLYVAAVCDDGTESNSDVITFTTECMPISEVPQTWDFENNNTAGTSSYPLPACWARGTSSSSYPYSYNYSTYAHSGSRMLYFSSTGNTGILPAIDGEALDLTHLQLSFFARTSSSLNQELQIGVMTDPADNSTFQLVQSVYINNTMEEFEVLFDGYEGEGAYIALRSNTTSSLYVDDVTLDVAPACPKVQNITVTGVTESTATVAWTGSSENGYDVKYRKVGEDNWNEETTSTESIELTGLDASSIYEVKIAPVCPEGDVQWVTAMFSTACSSDPIVNFPWNEGFESGNFGCWTVEHVTGDEAWEIVSQGYSSNYGPESGSYFAHLLVDGSTLPKTEEYLISPILDITGLSNPYMSFHYYGHYWQSNLDSIAVYYRTEPSAEWTYITGYPSQGGHDWMFDSVALPNASATYQVAFLGYSHNGYGVGVDNITVYDGDGAGPAVVNPTVATNDATNVTETTATLNGAITNAGNQTITARGFEWKAVSGGTVATVSATGTTNFTAPLTGLAEGTEYTFRAFATTANGNSYGQWKNFTTNSSSVEPCNTPTNVAASNITKESMTITWNANGASKWNLQYRVVNGAWSTVTVEGNPTYTITDLTEATEYQIQVQAVCDGATSPWSTMISQSTGINARLMGSISLYPNPASNYVDVRVSDNDIAVSRLEVYDVYGKLINEVEVIENPTRINVENLASGMYFVKVITNDGVATKNFIKK